jgi:hypothetical protein
LNASERRLEIPTHSRDKITEGAPIEVVAVPAGGGEAAWLSNGAVYRSFGPKRTAKLCNANSCFLSYSPNGELLAVLSWADRNDKRKLEVYDQLGGSRKARIRWFTGLLRSPFTGSLIANFVPTAQRAQPSFRLENAI